MKTIGKLWSGLKPLLIAGLLGQALSAAAGGTIIHEPVRQHLPGEPLIVYVMVSSETEVDNVRILYRPAGQTGYSEDFLDRYDDIWRGAIPNDQLAVPELEYFIAATLIDGSILTYPEIDAEDAPQLVRIGGGKEPVASAGKPVAPGTAPRALGAGEILIFSPEPSEVVPFDDIYIAASLFNVPNVDVASIRIKIDGKDVTPRAAVSADLVAFNPTAMTPGKHFAQITLKNQAGNPIPSKSWSFIVTGETKEEITHALTYRGKINGNFSRDPQGGGDYLDIYKTSASLSGQWKSLKFKTDLRLTSDEDPYKPAKNRYSMVLGAGQWLNLNFGDFSARHSRYTLDGKRVRGFGLDLKTGYVNLQVAKGQLVRNIQGNPATDLAYSGVFETVTDEDDSTITKTVFQLDRKGYTFRRDILSGRLSFGSGRIFQLGFNVLKTKDDINSIDLAIDEAKITIPETEIYVDSVRISHLTGGVYRFDEIDQLNEEIFNTPGSGYWLEIGAPQEDNWAGNSPKDNIVIGSDVKLNLDRRRIQLEAGFAFSMLNADIWNGAISKAALDTLMDDSTDGWIGRTYNDDGSIADNGFVEVDAIPIDPADYENIFTINENMIPLIPIDLDSAQMADDPLQAILQMPSLAYNYRASANYFNNLVSLEYKRVGPKFKSLGNPYLQSDLRELLISDRVRLLKNKLFVGVTYRHQDNQTLRTTTTVTTTETYTLNVGAYPGREYPTVNFKISAKPRYNNRTDQDTTGIDSVLVIAGTDTTADITAYYLDDKRLSENTINASIGLNYSLAALGLKHNLAVNYTRIEKDDQISDRYESGDPTFSIGALNDTTFYDTTYASPYLASNATTLSVVTQYKIPLKTTVVLSFNNQNTATTEQGITGINVNATYDLIKNKLKLNGGAGFISGSGTNSFTRFNLRGGVTYKLMESMTIRGNADFRGVNAAGSNDTSLILRADISYLF
ncbi:MAG: hypothetical protein ABIA75_00640 [Candidatus Neomarinimicrobiota bacterium]